MFTLTIVIFELFVSCTFLLPTIPKKLITEYGKCSTDFDVFPVSRHFPYSKDLAVFSPVSRHFPYSKDFAVFPVSRHFPHSKDFAVFPVSRQFSYSVTPPVVFKSV